MVTVALALFDYVSIVSYASAEWVIYMFWSIVEKNPNSACQYMMLMAKIVPNISMMVGVYMMYLWLCEQLVWNKHQCPESRENLYL